MSFPSDADVDLDRLRMSFDDVCPRGGTSASSRPPSLASGGPKSYGLVASTPESQASSYCRYWSQDASVMRDSSSSAVEAFGSSIPTTSGAVGFADSAIGRGLAPDGLKNKFSEPATVGTDSSETMFTTSVGPSVSASVTFRKAFALEDKQLLRAARLGDVMAAGARLMSPPSKGGQSQWWATAGAYEKSQPVADLDVFISHNWAAPRHTKFMQLALYFNWPAASLCALTAAAIGVCLNLAQVLPMFDCDGAPPMCMACFVLGNVAYFAVLISWVELQKAFGCRRCTPRVFFDKLCIHQTDAELKRKGIGALGACILHSQRMLVLHSHVYFRKLWTVYELATFMSVHSMRKLVLIPRFLPTIVVAFPLMYFCCYLLYFALLLKPPADLSVPEGCGRFRPELSSHGVILGPIALLACAVSFRMLRQWAVEQAEIQDQLGVFRISNAQCFDERDRPLVYANIVAFEKIHGAVGADSSERRALAAFDRRVRRNIRRAVGRVLGRVGIPYRYAVAAFASESFVALDSFCSQLLDGNVPPRKMAIELLEQCVTLNLLLLPLLIIGMLAFFSKRGLSMQNPSSFSGSSTDCSSVDPPARYRSETVSSLAGIRTANCPLSAYVEISLTTFASATAAGCWAGAVTLHSELSRAACTSDLALAALVAVQVPLAAAVWLAYTKPPLGHAQVGHPESLGSHGAATSVLDRLTRLARSGAVATRDSDDGSGSESTAGRLTCETVLWPEDDSDASASELSSPTAVAVRESHALEVTCRNDLATEINSPVHMAATCPTLDMEVGNVRSRVRHNNVLPTHIEHLADECVDKVLEQMRSGALPCPELTHESLGSELPVLAYPEEPGSAALANCLWPTFCSPVACSDGLASV